MEDDYTVGIYSDKLLEDYQKAISKYNYSQDIYTLYISEIIESDKFILFAKIKQEIDEIDLADFFELIDFLKKD